MPITPLAISMAVTKEHMKPLSKDALEAVGVEIDHLFSEGWYFKVSHIKSGTQLAKHIHSYDHPSFLVDGIAIVEIDGKETFVTGPQALTVEKNREHKVIAVTDIVWICAHETDDTNPDTVDISLMSKVIDEK